MPKLKPGTVVALVALFVALGGTGYAALALPKNSVTTKQVKDHSLMARDFRAGQIPAGARGRDGHDGAPGADGAQGPAGIASVSQVVGPPAYQCGTNVGGACTVAGAQASCPTGTIVIAGGFSVDVPNEDLDNSQRVSATTWGVIGTNDFSNSANLRAVAICASGPGATAASARAARSGRYSQMLRLLKAKAAARSR